MPCHSGGCNRKSSETLGTFIEYHYPEDWGELEMSITPTIALTPTLPQTTIFHQARIEISPPINSGAILRNTR